MRLCSSACQCVITFFVTLLFAVTCEIRLPGSANMRRGPPAWQGYPGGHLTTLVDGRSHYPHILVQIALPAQDISAPLSVCRFVFYLRSIPSISPALVGSHKAICAFTQAPLKRCLSPITSLLIMRLSRIVHSGTMMKYTSLGRR